MYVVCVVVSTGMEKLGRGGGVLGGVTPLVHGARSIPATLSHTIEFPVLRTLKDSRYRAAQ